MSRECFYELFELVKSKIQRQETIFKNTISAEERLVITLRYLSAGCSMTELHHSYQHGISTISGIVKDTCKQIYKTLREIYLPELKKEDWLRIAEGFATKANFPNCLGAVDGKHVRIIKPPKSGSLYYNYKKFFSIVLLAICDSNYKFIFIDVGSYGKASDSQIFRNSVFFKKLEDNSLNIPSSRAITENGSPLPFVFVGDEAFGISNFIQRPYSGNYLNLQQKIYNYRLSRARRYIECTFGIMTNKWRILHRPINVDISFATDIVKAICVLHNFLQRDCDLFIHDRQIDEVVRNEQNLPATTVPDKFAEYFVNEGQLSWQNNKI
ncbi:protein ANTAGONIST OF LIKE HETEROCHROMATIN PROTEIN 1-like [Trichoplusia ni]|uniref:Protein ANTAGONIST OF LIKE HETEROCHROMATIN PROTEIN 1-like n=1 Tax=Trichoplusia ni TaxID=7111 RepID=A0A7E5VJ72_TRINI|nr:protein ANTAGONIST OF LIKE HETEROCHROMATIN PROTEIN 1-like [Trichoplusia ni]